MESRLGDVSERAIPLAWYDAGMARRAQSKKVPVSYVRVNEHNIVVDSSMDGEDGKFIGVHVSHVIPDFHGRYGEAIPCTVDTKPKMAVQMKFDCGTVFMIFESAAVESMEGELHRSNEDLEHFAFAASHDLQEPLRMIMRFSEVLASELTDLSDEHREYMGYVISNAKRMSMLVNGLLAYSRVGRERHFLRVDMNKCLDDVRALLSAQIESSGAKIDGSLPAVYGDRPMLTALIQNLVSNAIKFSANAPVIRVGWTDLGTHWHMFVDDESGGFDPDMSSDVFQMFRRVGSDRSGAGIGLAVCRKVVALHDGEIWADTRPADGTTIHFTVRKLDNE